MRVLDQIFCICDPVQFQKNKNENVLALFDSESKINAMTPAWAAQLGLKVQKTNVSAQKIEESSLKIYNIIIIVFQVLNKLCRFRFFQKTFLLSNISMDVAAGMLFLIFNNADV